MLCRQRWSAVLSRRMLRDNSKTWVIGFELRPQTEPWLRPSSHSTLVLPAEAQLSKKIVISFEIVLKTDHYFYAL